MTWILIAFTGVALAYLGFRSNTRSLPLAGMVTLSFGLGLSVLFLLFLLPF